VLKLKLKLPLSLFVRRRVVCRWSRVRPSPSLLPYLLVRQSLLDGLTLENRCESWCISNIGSVYITYYSYCARYYSYIGAHTGNRRNVTSERRMVELWYHTICNVMLCQPNQCERLHIPACQGICYQNRPPYNMYTGQFICYNKQRKSPVLSCLSPFEKLRGGQISHPQPVT
jgi:hypothetical protein